MKMKKLIPCYFIFFIISSLLIGCGGSNSDSITQTGTDPDPDFTAPTNKSPIINVGPDLEVAQKTPQTITPDASDADGNIVSYSWKENGIILSNESMLKTDNLDMGVHDISVTVTDDKGATASDSLIIKIGLYVLRKSEFITLENDSYYTQNTRNYLHDDKGNLLSESFDNNSDGSINGLASYTYNEENKLLTHSIDSDFNGEVNALTTYNYDSQNRLLSKMINESGRYFDRVWNYTYDDSGNISSLIIVPVQTNLRSGHHSYHYSYDSNNNLLVYRSDNDNDGTIDYTETNTYNTQNKIIVKVGSTGGVTNYTYDAQGNLLTETVNLLNSKQSTYTYDTDNNMLSETHEYDGEIKQEILYTYDDEGYLLTETAVVGDIMKNEYAHFQGEADSSINYKSSDRTYDVHKNLLTINFEDYQQDFLLNFMQPPSPRENIQQQNTWEFIVN